MPTGADEAVAAVIPYRNPQALTAYYLGLFGVFLSCIPVIGLGMCIAALVLGIRGFQAVRRNPEAKGTVHAWIGIVGGGIGVLIGLLSTIGTAVSIIYALMGKPPGG
jgi:hypothetical protein